MACGKGPAAGHGPADSGLNTQTHTKEAGKCPEEACASRGTEPSQTLPRPPRHPGYRTPHSQPSSPPAPPPRPPPMKFLPLLGECSASLVTAIAGGEEFLQGGARVASLSGKVSEED